MDRKTYILCTDKPWHDQLFEKLHLRGQENWVRLRRKEELTIENLRILSPNKIFLPHWSHLIAKEIIEVFECIIFHMTDLPYGRGGSPLQNLIIQGFNETKISAIRADEGLDTGDIYLKKNLSLQGTAEEIFKRASDVIEDMIMEIITLNPAPQPQSGKPVIFKRRTPDMSDISSIEELNKLFDHIRMLDAEGYPHANLETNSFKLEFRNAQLKKNEIIANVRIIKK
ncbi:MAG: formyltransferase family protein [Cyclobacteriaceae bacterium]